MLVRVGTEASAELAAELQLQQQLQLKQPNSSPAAAAAAAAEGERAQSPPALEATPAPLSAAEARRVVNSVFERCYNDLAPFGRRLRGRGHDSVDARHALELKHLRDRLARLFSSSLPKSSDSQ